MVEKQSIYLILTKHLIFHKTWNSFKDLFFQFEHFKFLVHEEEEKWLLKNSLNVWGDSWIADGIVIHGQEYKSICVIMLIDFSLILIHSCPW